MTTELSELDTCTSSIWRFENMLFRYREWYINEDGSIVEDRSDIFMYIANMEVEATLEGPQCEVEQTAAITSSTR